jgi:hydroxymethylbilane synthase
MKKLRIASRKSPLALCQTEWVKTALQQVYPLLEIEIIGMTTEGDRRLDTNLTNIGGKGLFIKELENALLEDRADIAVHSIKDITAVFPDGLMLGAICERADPRDVFISNKFSGFADLPPESIIGTASLRRQSQLQSLRPDLVFQSLRGNVNTRLQKLDEEKYDAIILAAAGLIRLSLEHRITEYLPIDTCMPAVGQGALGIECRTDDHDIRDLISVLDHAPTRCCILAERAMNLALGGNCHVPISGYAVLDDDLLIVRGVVASPDGKQVIRGEMRGLAESAEFLGEALGEDLLTRGAKEILEQN